MFSQRVKSTTHEANRQHLPALIAAANSKKEITEIIKLVKTSDLQSLDEASRQRIASFFNTVKSITKVLDGIYDSGDYERLEVIADIFALNQKKKITDSKDFFAVYMTQKEFNHNVMLVESYYRVSYDYQEKRNRYRYQADWPFLDSCAPRRKFSWLDPLWDKFMNDGWSPAWSLIPQYELLEKFKEKCARKNNAMFAIMMNDLIDLANTLREVKSVYKNLLELERAYVESHNWVHCKHQSQFINHPYVMSKLPGMISSLDDFVWVYSRLNAENQKQLFQKCQSDVIPVKYHVDALLSTQQAQADVDALHRAIALVHPQPIKTKQDWVGALQDEQVFKTLDSVTAVCERLKSNQRLLHLFVGELIKHNNLKCVDSVAKYLQLTTYCADDQQAALFNRCRDRLNFLTNTPHEFKTLYRKLPEALRERYRRLMHVEVSVWTKHGVLDMAKMRKHRHRHQACLEEQVPHVESLHTKPSSDSKQRMRYRLYSPSKSQDSARSSSCDELSVDGGEPLASLKRANRLVRH